MDLDIKDSHDDDNNDCIPLCMIIRAVIFDWEREFYIKIYLKLLWFW